MNRRWIPLLLAGLLGTAACFGGPPPPPPPPPPPATQICGQNFSSAGNYLISFYNLAHANTGFITADGFVPARLPDGRTLWWMSDTNTGTANADNSISNAGFRHNSVVWQEGSCLRPQLGNPDIINGSGGAWFWPGATIIQGNTMLVFSHKVEAASGPPGFEWRVIGSSVARFSWPSLQLLGTRQLPTKNPPNGGGPVPWGVRAVTGSDGLVYLYGKTHFVNPFAGAVGEAWLARASFSELADTNTSIELEYFTNPVAETPVTPAWSSSPNDAQPMTFTENLVQESSPLAQLSVVPYGNRYLAVAFAADAADAANGSPVWAWEADTPTGPWKKVMNGTSPRTIMTFTERSSDQLAYDARIARLQGTPGWTIVYSVNSPSLGWQDWTYYRGEFKAPSGLPPE